MAKYKFEKQFMFSNKNQEDVEIFLSDCENIDLFLIRDSRKNTILHQCAFQNQPNTLRLYVQYFRKVLENQGLTFSEIKAKTRKFVDERNEQGFTAIHYAAYKGNVKIIEQLIKYQADLNLSTGSGLGISHLAAQGDKVRTFLALPQLDLNAKDSKGSTPLHWAAFSGAEKIVEYLLAQPSINLNPIDGQLQTPLHLSSGYGNIKIVKRLLLAGCNRHLHNLAGKTALDIAAQNEFENIRRMLDQNWGLIDCIKFICNIKIKYQPRDRSLALPIAFLLCQLVVVGVLFGCYEFDLPVAIAQGLFFALTVLIFISLLPGPHKREKNNYSNYLDFHPISSLCMSCVRPAPPRAFHCEVCKVCIPQYDHHCKWINNCVGKRNLSRFVLFIFLITADLAWIGVVGSASLAKITGSTAFGGWMRSREWMKDHQWAQYASAIIFLLLPLLFLLPLLSLLIVQVKNLLLNKTTYERFSKINQSILTRPGLSSDYQSTSSPGLSFRNCWNMINSEEYQDQIQERAHKKSDKSKSTSSSAVDPRNRSGRMTGE